MVVVAAVKLDRKSLAEDVDNASNADWLCASDVTIEINLDLKVISNE